MTTIISAGHVVLPDRVAHDAALVVEGDRILEVRERHSVQADAALEEGWLVPGFVDVHVHGVEGLDVLDDGSPVAAIASRMPKFGVTAFCPTTVACSPAHLEEVLRSVDAARRQPRPGSARVLPAHLESNFINPDYRGAQPLSCLVLPPGPALSGARRFPPSGAEFDGRAILDVILARPAEVGIVTMAPELPNGLDLLRTLREIGIVVSLGHSGAAYEEARAAIAAGACHATHLFNRMTPLGHRDPGLTGAVLESDEVLAELICDGHHVHPATMRMALLLKGPRRMIAITDGTSGSGLPRGASAHLGGRRIRVADTALLDDGTLAGSVLTMDVAFRNLVSILGLSPLEASWLCSANPAGQLGLETRGRLAPGMAADFVLLDRELRPVRTFIAGEEAWARDAA
jgi:N-acetylglucosamine-6-phosphate deacetylase